MPPVPRLASTAVVVAAVLLLCLFHSPAAHAADESGLTAEQQANTLKFLQAFGGAAPGLQSTWTGTSFCSWPGVTCSEAAVDVSFEDVTLTSPMTLPEVPSDVDATKVAVTSLRIFNKVGMVTGTLPASWGGLPQLQKVDLHGNALSGTLPSAWAGMTAMRDVYMDNNQLSGSLPDAWKGMAALESVSVASNALTGTLPAAWSTMTALQMIDLSGNALSGTLPAVWTGMKALETVQLSTNDLSGSLPASWGTMPALAYVFVTGNAFCGCLPAEWRVSGNLYYLVDAALTASSCAATNVCGTSSEAPFSTTTTTTTTAGPAAHKSSGPNLTALWCVIGAVGGLLVIAGIVVAAVMYHRRAKAAQAQNAEGMSEEKSSEPYSTTADSSV